jgi:outer membrane lipoprotein-sorting protein
VQGRGRFPKEDDMTRTIATLFAATTATLGLIGSVFAADMSEAEISAFLKGKTTYLETTAASATAKPGQGAIYWANDGTAFYKTPSGAVWHGKWSTGEPDRLCVDWKERPNNGCVKYVKDGDKVTIHTEGTGELRATIVKTATGNAENILIDAQ